MKLFAQAPGKGYAKNVTSREDDATWFPVPIDVRVSSTPGNSQPVGIEESIRIALDAPLGDRMVVDSGRVSVPALP